MALVNTTTGEYLKVVGVQTDFALGNHAVIYYLFENLEQRQNYENGLSQYNPFIPGYWNGQGPIETVLQTLADATKTIKDAILTAGYNALKADPLFAGWADA